MWPNGQAINEIDSTPTALASCVFNNKLYLFWPANDSSNLIYYSASGTGTSWPPSQTINNTDKTTHALAACVFNNSLYLFWKPATGLGIYYSASANGRTWPPGQLINQTDTTPDALAACVLGSQLYLFWRDSASSQIIATVSNDGASFPAGQAINSTDSTSSTLSACVYFGAGILLFWKGASNELYYSWSAGADASGGVTFPPGVVINQTDSTSQAPTACASVNQLWLFLFWVGNDTNRQLWFSAGNPNPAIAAAGGFLPGPGLPGLGSNWPAGQLVDSFDSTSAPISAAVFNGMLFLFWKSNDSLNRLWFASAAIDFQLTITVSGSSVGVAYAVCQYNSQPFAYGPTNQAIATNPFYVWYMGIPPNTTMTWTAPGYSAQSVSNVASDGTALSSAAITLTYAPPL